MKNILMVGVDKKRIGGMWTVAETYLKDKTFRKEANVWYVPTNSYGSVLRRLVTMAKGYLRIICILATRPIDVVHIHMAEKGSTFRKGGVVFLAKLFHKKVMVQLHAGPFMAWYQGLDSGKQHMIQKIFSKADMVCALGEYWKTELEQLIPAEKLRVLYNGSHCPKKNLYNPDGKKILYLGVMKQAKGTFDLIKAMESIDSQLDPEIKLYLCGKAEEDGIEEEIRARHLEDRIVLPGWITKEERLELCKDAMLLVHPSYFEALSMTMIEAICYGIPVVTTNISTSSELLGADTELVEPGDWEHLGQLLLTWAEDRQFRVEKSQELYERAKRLFSVEKNIADTLKLYDELIESGL